MKNLAFYLWATVIICGIYVIITFILFRRIKAALNNADLIAFKAMLGTNYQYREHKGGWTKYKWQIMFMIVKASFDEDGQMMEWEIRLFSFLPFFYRRSIA